MHDYVQQKTSVAKLLEDSALAHASETYMAVSGSAANLPVCLLSACVSGLSHTRTAMSICPSMFSVPRRGYARKRLATGDSAPTN